MTYARQLRRVSEHSAQIISAYTNDDGLIDIDDIDDMMRASYSYSAALTPWAGRIVSNMIKEVMRVNSYNWKRYAEKLNKDVKKLLDTSTVASTIASLQRDQVQYVTKIPVDLAERAQNLARQAVISGSRADEIAGQIRNSADVSKSYSTMLARTQIANTNAEITATRARSVGINQYIWRTTEDGAVRESHAEMDGKVFSYDDPPEVGDEGAHGPGQFPNCRCYSEPVI